jgi:hypothetical protein
MCIRYIPQNKLQSPGSCVCARTTLCACARTSIYLQANIFGRHFSCGLHPAGLAPIDLCFHLEFGWRDSQSIDLDEEGQEHNGRPAIHVADISKFLFITNSFHCRNSVQRIFFPNYEPRRSAPVPPLCAPVVSIQGNNIL